jgi:hypothetical protein
MSFWCVEEKQNIDLSNKYITLKLSGLFDSKKPNHQKNPYSKYQLPFPSKFSHEPNKTLAKNLISFTLIDWLKL